jgi:hypothetical protein
VAKRVGLEIRKPGAQRTPSVDAFVSQGSTAAKSAPARGLLQRAGGRVTRRMTMYVDPDLAKRVQVYCVVNGREISDVASEALERFLEEHASGTDKAHGPARRTG